MINYKEALKIAQAKYIVLRCDVYKNGWDFYCFDVRSNKNAELVVLEDGRTSTINDFERTEMGDRIRSFFVLDERIPKIAYDNALKIASSRFPLMIDYCTEYENGWIFGNSKCEKDGGRGKPIVVLRDGRTTMSPEFLLRIGTGRELRQIAVK